MENLKIISFEDENKKQQNIVADTLKTHQIKVLLYNFAFVAVILLLLTLISPDGLSKQIIRVKLPVYAAGGPFDIKTMMKEVSPFFQRISFSLRFISKEENGTFSTNGNCIFKSYKNGEEISNRNIYFSERKFDLAVNKENCSWTKILNVNSIYYDSFDMIIHFPCAAKKAEFAEILIETNTVAFTCFEMWCRAAFSIALGIVMMRNTKIQLSNEFNFTFYTYLLLFINLIGNNPLQAFSIAYPSKIFMYLDNFLVSVQETYNIFYCFWIFLTTCENTNIAFILSPFAIIVQIYYLLNFGFKTEIPSNSETNTIFALVFSIGMMICMVKDMMVNREFDTQKKERKVAYLIIIIITRIPHYAILLFPKIDQVLNKTFAMIADFMSNNFFALLMLYVNSLVSNETLNTYFSPSSDYNDVILIEED